MEDKKRWLILFCNKLFINIDVKVRDCLKKIPERYERENELKPEEKNLDEMMRMQHA